jgi:uncharacterized membrane protein YgcG
MARGARRSVAIAAAAWVLLLATSALAKAAVPPGPPFPDQESDRFVYDQAAAFSPAVRDAITSSLSALKQDTGADLVVYTQVKPASKTRVQVQADATALRDQWQLGGTSRDGAVMFWDLTKDKSGAIVAFAGGDTFLARIDPSILATILSTTSGVSLAGGVRDAALSASIATLDSTIRASEAVSSPGPSTSAGRPTAKATPLAIPSSGPARPSGPAPAAGPPYPPPVPNVTVYDYAGVFKPATIASVEQTIAGIEARTGAEAVVYTQVKPSSDTPDAAEADAAALIDQWGVGRKGFDDGLAILFDLDESKCHGQVQLYGAPGYRATYLTNSERQSIFDDTMVPFLRQCDLDDALLAAMARVDAAATPEHAQKLQVARQLDAAVGLVVAPLALMALVGWAGWSWLRFGRDPVYLDDPSILMAGPPPEMTAPAAAVVMEGKSTRRALTTAMIDLASRAEMAFRQDKGLLHSKVGIQMTTPDASNAQVALNRRRPTDPAEDFALARLGGIAAGETDAYIDPDALLEFGKSATGFDRRLDAYVAGKGWFREPPDKSVERWSFRGGIVFVLGIVALVAGYNLPSTGLELLGIAVVVGGIAIFIIARTMPQRTMAGAMAYAMLAAYRRTLQKTLEQSRSMDQVVAARTVPWLETPDQAVVWGVALGLHREVEDVLQRSLEDMERGSATVMPYFPVWYWSGSGTPGGGSSAGGGLAAGVFSSSAIPDFGGMMSALGTIGNSPPSSGSGGFSGGGSGGGGGGAGGGF